MSVFVIRRDDWKYQELGLSIDDYIDHIPESYTYEEVILFSRYNLKFSSWWKVIDTRFETPEGMANLPIPDITTWEGATLVLSQRATDTLGTQLSPHGELLPLSISGETYYLFNCLEVGQIDEINSKHIIEDNEIIGIKTLAFNHTDIKYKSVFKTPFDNGSSLYCAENFKHLVEDNELRGIKFSENFTSTF